LKNENGASHGDNRVTHRESHSAIADDIKGSPFYISIYSSRMADSKEWSRKLEDVIGLLFTCTRKLCISKEETIVT